MKHENSDPATVSMVGSLYRKAAPRIVALLSRRFGFGHIDQAMDAVQDAFEAALGAWPVSGVPNNPEGWLARVARNRMINRLNADRHLKSSDESADFYAGDEVRYSEAEVGDSQLNLLLFFAQLPFSSKNKTIVTLYYLCGFGYAELGNALLMNEEAVKKVIFRSKGFLRNFRSDRDYVDVRIVEVHLQEILKILYLLFNEGYKSTRKAESVTYDLCYEAMRLTKLVLEFQLESASACSLLAMMFFNVSRFPARVREGGLLLTMEEQDRTLWNRELIAEGKYYLDRGLEHRPVEDKYYYEALIASLHCQALSYETTDWQRIAFLYGQLEKLYPGSFSLRYNRIIAESNFKLLTEQIFELDVLPLPAGRSDLFTYYLCKAHLLKRLNNKVEATHFYRAALSVSLSTADKLFIQKKLVELEIL